MTYPVLRHVVHEARPTVADVLACLPLGTTLRDGAGSDVAPTAAMCATLPSAWQPGSLSEHGVISVAPLEVVAPWGASCPWRRADAAAPYAASKLHVVTGLTTDAALAAALSVDVTVPRWSGAPRYALTVWTGAERDIVKAWRATHFDHARATTLFGGLFTGRFVAPRAAEGRARTPYDVGGSLAARLGDDSVWLDAWWTHLITAVNARLDAQRVAEPTPTTQLVPMTPEAVFTTVAVTTAEREGVSHGAVGTTCFDQGTETA